MMRPDPKATVWISYEPCGCAGSTAVIVDLHRLVENRSLVKESQLERKTRIAPVGPVGPEAEVPVLVMRTAKYRREERRVVPSVRRSGDFRSLPLDQPGARARLQLEKLQPAKVKRSTSLGNLVRAYRSIAWTVQVLPPFVLKVMSS